MFSRTVFPNGLRLITIPKKGAESVTILVLVRAGSKYETKDTNGISHFLEHLLFKGTKKRSAREIAILIDRIGGASNAFTSQEYTGYWAKAAQEHFPVVCDLLSDIFLHAKLAPKEIEKERGVVLEEIKLYNDTPSDKIGDVFTDLLYGDQPAGWEILGSPENIRRLQRADVLRHIHKHYAAQGTVVVAAGDMATSAVRKEIAKHFAPIRKATPPALPRTEEQQSSPAVRVLHKSTDQTHIALGTRTFSTFDPRRFALEVLRTILGGGISSRLFQEIRDKRGAAYHIRTEVHLGFDAGFLVTWAGVAHQRVLEVVKAVVHEYRKIAARSPGAKELKKAKERITGSLRLRLETTDDLAGYVGAQEIITGEILEPEEYLQRIQKVSSGDVLRVAQDIMRRSYLNLALIRPQESGLEKTLEHILTKGLG